MKYHQTHHQIQIRHHFYHAQIWVISKTEIGYTAPVNVTNVWHLKMIPVQNVTIYTIYDTVMFQNLGLFSMKLFLGVTGKVYHVLPANKIHETKRLSARMILFRVSLNKLYVNITQLPVIIKFRIFLRRHFQRRKMEFSNFLRIFDRPVLGWDVTNSLNDLK